MKAKPWLRHLKPEAYTSPQCWLDSAKNDDRLATSTVYASTIPVDYTKADYWHLYDHVTKERWILEVPLAGIHRSSIRTAMRELYVANRTEFFIQIASVGGFAHSLADIGEPIQQIPTRDRDRIFWVTYSFPDTSFRVGRLVLCKKSALFY